MTYTKDAEIRSRRGMANFVTNMCEHNNLKPILTDGRTEFECECGAILDWEEYKMYLSAYMYDDYLVNSVTGN